MKIPRMGPQKTPNEINKPVIKEKNLPYKNRYMIIFVRFNNFYEIYMVKFQEKTTSGNVD